MIRRAALLELVLKVAYGYRKTVEATSVNESWTSLPENESPIVLGERSDRAAGRSCKHTPAKGSDL